MFSDPNQARDTHEHGGGSYRRLEILTKAEINLAFGLMMMQQIIYT